MSSYREATRDYVQSAKGVVGAADMLKTAVLGGDTGDIEFATDLLARAADDYLGNVARHEKFGFDEIARASELELPKKERVAGDILASALADIEVANTLLLAGRASGETPTLVSAAELEQAASQLDDLTNAVALPLGRSIDQPLRAARFGFDGVPAVAAGVASPNLDTAKANFDQCVHSTLDTLIVESKKVLKTGFESVEELDDESLGQAIANVGITVVQLPKVGKLISRGLEIAVLGLTKLTKLLGEENVAALKEKAQELVDEFKEGAEPLDKFLKYSYGVDKTKTRVAELLESTTAQVSQIDQGAQMLAELQVRFVENMTLVGRIVDGLNKGKKLVGALLPQASAVLLFGAFYLVAMDYAILCAMDYADTTTLVRFIEGVIKISDATLG